VGRTLSVQRHVDRLKAANWRELLTVNAKRKSRISPEKNSGAADPRLAPRERLTAMPVNRWLAVLRQPEKMKEPR
jgi:hypothetical protein